MYLVSACLAGVNCKYNGGNNYIKEIYEMVMDGSAIPVCPENLGGLSTPRIPCEIIQDKNNNRKVVNSDGTDLTKEFISGAEKTLAIVKITGIKKAILQSRSPSCGCGKVYDGTFSGVLTNGNGLCAELLKNNGVEVYNEKKYLEEKNK